MPGGKVRMPLSPDTKALACASVAVATWMAPGVLSEAVSARRWAASNSILQHHRCGLKEATVDGQRPCDAASALHTLYRLSDGSSLSFFEAPEMPFEFKPQQDYDLHIALEVDRPTLDAMLAKGPACGIETRCM